MFNLSETNLNSDRTVPARPTQIKFQPTRNDQLPPRPISATRPKTTGSILKSTVAQWPSSDQRNELQTSSSTGFLNDVRRMVSEHLIYPSTNDHNLPFKDQSLQRIGTSNKNERYV